MDFIFIYIYIKSYIANFGNFKSVKFFVTARSELNVLQYLIGTRRHFIDQVAFTYVLERSLSEPVPREPVPES
jgi:hypothetical protein